jgi:hypothetical protein
VSRELPDLPHVPSGIQRRRRGGVPQPVGAQGSGQAGGFPQPAHDQPHRFPRESAWLGDIESMDQGDGPTVEADAVEA